MRKRNGLRWTLMRTQREVLCEVMLCAAECECWLTLDELAKLTQFPATSISAQLRHLRKPQYGSFLLEKRRREENEVLRHDFGVVWEYRLRRGVRPGRRAAGMKREGKMAVHRAVSSGRHLLSVEH